MLRSASARPRILPLSAAALALALLAGCAPTTPAEGGEPAPSTAPAATAAESVQVVDGWIKAVDDGMTAGFAILENTGTASVTLEGAETTAASMVQLHEMVMLDGAMVMQPKVGGIEIAPGATHELAPGGDHIMLMGVGTPLQPGDEVLVTLRFSDGSTLDHVFTVKEFTGAEEEYVGGMSGNGNGSGNG
jgi:copper(I)-binding protein